MITQFFARLPLRYKMILPTWLMVTFIIGIIGAVAIQFNVNSQSINLSHRISVLTQAVANTLQAAMTFEDAITAKEQLNNLSVDPDIIAAQIIDVHGENFVDIQRMPRGCAWNNGVVQCQDTQFDVHSIPILLGNEPLGTLKVWVSLEFLHAISNKMWMSLVIITLTLSVLAWLFARALHSVIVTPLTTLHSSMEKMTRDGVLKKEIPIVHNDELGKLTACFNEMVSSLREREHQLQSALNSVEQKNRYIFRALDVMRRGIVVVSPGDSISYYNPAASRELTNISNLNHTRDVLEQCFEPRQAIEEVREAIEKQQALHAIEMHSINTNKHYQVSCHPMGENKHVLLQFEDITERNLAEHRRKLVELMFEQNQDAVFVLSRGFEIEMQNQKSDQLFGHLNSIRDLIFENGLGNLAQLKMLLAQSQFSIKTRVQCNDEWLPCLLTVRSLRNAKGKVEAFVFTLIDQSVELELKRLNYVANHDPLTGLANRVNAVDRLQETHDNNTSQMICFIDLDGFKAINDQHGHAVGDKLLCLVAKRLLGCLAQEDIVARLSGDEFLLGINGMGSSPSIFKRVVERLATPFLIDDITCEVTASLGISYWPASDRTSLDTKITEADEAMYIAKRQGKNQFYCLDHSYNDGYIALCDHVR
ncbi:diguanylate cyclase domain-containing protein [Vibrio renipiscarius]|uniref:Diguanylate cyclase n=1 Tax=Vibrio renipiscarius TaxID=1461322 RepID=A0A0C2NUY3_9VIBR|nr:diguanylate cyclase [Vibrio renipiscarius]KII76506.1 diguanylate cyclase [Vibrio renipiscarius]KII77972.1 diguanylate cyclase [Vibrio renipiscarius]